MTTVSESAEVHTSTPVGPVRALNAQRRRVRAREAATPKPVTQRAQKVRVSPFHSAPASVADVIAYTRSGDWVPGEQARVLEAAGKAYGWVIAVPLSIAAYALVWVLQRPARAFLAAAVGAVMAAMLPARTFAGGLPLALAVATVTAAVITHTPGKEGTS